MACGIEFVGLVMKFGKGVSGSKRSSYKNSFPMADFVLTLRETWLVGCTTHKGSLHVEA